MFARLPIAALLVAVTALGLTACGSDDNGSSSNTSASTTSSPATSTTAKATEPAAVTTRETSLGVVLVNGEGLTLYAFDNDKDGKPTCTGGCSNTWPPLLVAGKITVGADLDQGDFATVANPDGGKQLTTYGRPLYLYFNDSAPGDVNGQGIGGVWHAVAPDGTSIMGASSSSTTGSSNTTGGYGY